MKHYYIKTKKAVGATLLALTALLTLPAAAQTVKDQAGSPYAGKTYQYKDADGVSQPAYYLDRATDPYQMKGLIGSIIADKTIPGQKVVWGESGEDVNAKYDVVVSMTQRNNQGNHSYTQYHVDATYANWFYEFYKNYTPKFSTLTPGEDYTFFQHVSNGKNDKTYYYKRSVYDLTPDDAVDANGKEIKTVILVELKDDFDRETTSAKLKAYTDDQHGTYYDEAWKCIKAIQVMPLSHQMRVEDSNKNMSGTLVSINKDLNKFFVMLKGDIWQRAFNGYDNTQRKYMSRRYHRPPFEWYFEQLAAMDVDNPNSDAISYDGVENALADMLKGKNFPVNHNCSAILHNGHPVYMKGVSDTDVTPTNMLLFIPDGRFVGSGDENPRDYDNYNDYNRTSGQDYRPYFFIQTITLESKLNSSDLNETTHEAWVKQNWTSTLRNVLKNNRYETFFIERSYDNGKTWSIVPAEEIDATRKNVDFVEDPTWTLGSLMQRENSAESEIYVKEPQLSYDRTVMYQVHGRIYNPDVEGKDFDFVVSKPTTVIIPGFDPLTNPDLAIQLVHESVYDNSKKQNNYTNTVNFLVRGEKNVDKALRRTHIAEDTYFQLRRYIDVVESSTDDNLANEDGKGVLLATYRVKEIATEDGHNKITLVCEDHAPGNNNGGEIVLVDNGTDGLTELTRPGFTAAGNHWGVYVDHYTYNITKHADDSRYTYRLFGENVKNFKKISADKTEEEISSGELRSKPEGVTMPRMDHDALLPTYTEAEIIADVNGQLSESVPELAFTPQAAGSAVLDLCEIVNAGNTNTKYATATYTSATSIWKLQSGESDATTSVIGKAAMVVAPREAMGKQVVMIIHDGTNTYGTPYVKVPKLPELTIKVPNLTFDNIGAHTVSGTVSVKHTAEGEALDQFHSHGYGMWAEYGYKGVRYEPADVNAACTELRHHKHLNDAADYSFNYGAGVTANEGTPLAQTAVTSNFNDKLASERVGTPDDPFTVWYRARYFAEYNKDGFVSGQAQKVSKDGDADDATDNRRFVIIQATAGVASTGTGTTGVEDINGESGFSVHGGFGEAVLDGNCNVVIVNMQGMVMFDGAIDGEVSVSLPAGLYIANGKKFIVR